MLIKFKLMLFDEKQKEKVFVSESGKLEEMMT